MSSKNYGPAVSGYLDPSGRNWETPVYQAGKPVLDKELNLGGDLAGGLTQAALRQLMPSGWIATDFLGTSDATSGIFQYTTLSNTLRIPNNLTAHVNGWLLTVANTGSTSRNQLTLPAPPVGLGARRTDLVILEVWRRLISAATGDGKSGLTRIWSNGNVKVTLDVNPYTLDDDLLDTNVGAETTKRVQIQYRLRVIPNVDLEAYPEGMDDPTVTASTVPASAGVPDGTSLISYTYSNQSSAGDSGLWVAGDGSGTAQTDLGTVDGFMYAVPLVGVVRRNSTVYDRLSNHNGAGIFSSGISGRPDGLFADVVDARDIIDLRRGVSPTGWNYQEVLARNLGLLLDNNLRTEWGATVKGGGYFGATVLTCDEIGVQPGTIPNVTGYTDGGNFIGQFDSVRRFFTDKPNTEIITVVYSAPGGSWTVGDAITIDPTSLPVYGASAFNWLNCNPAGGILVDVTNMRWVGEVAGKKANYSAEDYVGPITNLGTFPIVAPTFTFTSLPAIGLTNERLFIDLVVEYPAGLGLSRTPTNTYASSVSINNPSALPGVTLSSDYDTAHRGIRLQAQHPVVAAYTMIAVAATTQRLPERAVSIGTVTVNGVGATPTLSSDGTILTFPSALTAGHTIVVQYTPLRPVQANTIQVNIPYESRYPQTGKEASLPNPLTVTPRFIENFLHVLTVGSGSLDTAYPYPSAFTQIGGIYPTATGTFNGDHELSAGGKVYTSEFNASTGLLRLPIYVGYTPSPQEVSFERVAGHVDVEDRTFYPVATASFYDPNAYSQPLTDAKRHRNFLAFLAELPDDAAGGSVFFGRKGQLVMVLLVRAAIFDKTNGVFFNPDPNSNTTTACVFHIKGNLLNKRA